ncbi:hypothetical protein NLJ89_g1696 [Agrocybe chaxingu]|uniref:Uncharacterized protein n=1 Tax=Agrocybe chaxingu TaxID=84603 RepID=A0A9W8TEQ8_9AGAR|nr:hypothetical protein NLJ89_g1696 [Agrocybe chaxingu]
MSGNYFGLSSVLQKLEIPPDFTRYEEITEASTIVALDLWKQGVVQTLNELLAILRSTGESKLTVKDQGDIAFLCVPFEGICPWNDATQGGQSDSWVPVESMPIAKSILVLLPFSCSLQALVSQILTQNLRPIFRANPHPHLHTATGRKMGKPVGGHLAMQDYYEDQRWKKYPGIGSVVFWCVQNLESEAYENIWHLIIPPVMALLDDYEARYKLQGVEIVQELLRHVPKGLLRRTGVDGLLRQSLKNSLSNLQSPESPQLLRSAISASVNLTLLTTTVPPAGKPSSDRFDQLSSLLGEGIITGIWLYAEDKPVVVTATFDALPPLLEALGIGSARFLQALVPQLTHALIPRPLVDRDVQMQLSAIRVLETLMDVCKPRMKSWSETMLDGIGRCWVGLYDEEQRDATVNSEKRPKYLQGRDEVKRRLPKLCSKLIRVCPDIMQNYIPRFMEADRTLFQGLFIDVDS